MNTKIIVKMDQHAMHMLLLMQLGLFKAGSSAGFHNHIKK
jgi:hypothetical protein